ncbi:MAG: GGDEF domain-containing protein [Patescibacteria group bacterium]
MSERESDQRPEAAEFRVESDLDPWRIEEMVDAFLEDPDALNRTWDKLARDEREGRPDPVERAYVSAATRTIVEMAKESERDHLTGLRNRRALEGTVDTRGDFEKEVATAKREGYPLSFVVLDLKGFGEINEEKDHAIGDQTLREVGDAMKAIGYLVRSRLRSGDIGYRFGGDEFGIMLPRIGSKEQAETIVTRLGKHFPTNPVTGARVEMNEPLSVVTYQPTDREGDDADVAKELLVEVWQNLHKDKASGDSDPAEAG